MSLIPGLIISSNAFSASLLSDMDELGYQIPSGSFRRWQVSSSVQTTNNTTTTLYEYTVPASITGDCVLFFEANILSLCTSGTKSGSAAGRVLLMAMNRDGGTWRGPNVGGGTVETSSINGGGGAPSLSISADRSGDAMRIRMTAEASQTYTHKVLVNVAITYTP